MVHSEAVEKRLRAVYDAFDQRNHKGAIKLCNAGLQKYPDCHTFRSLKAVALERTGKREEALQVADEVLAAAPPDDHVLNMLLLVLKPAGRSQDVTAAYEKACSKQPNNEDLLQGLFNCHVRSSSYAAQQQTAMKLNKLHPSELYQWWVIASLALQAHAAAVQARLQPAPTTPGVSSSSNAAQASTAAAGVGGSSSSSSSPAAGLGSDKLLALAEAMAGRLLSKPPAGGGQHSWESVMMYLGLLQAQGKYDAALAAVRGPLGASFSLTAERREAEAAVLVAQGDLQAAAQLYQQALQEQPDDWAVLLLYLDCMLPATASTLPASCSTAVAQMVTGVEASTRPGCQIGGLAALLAAMSVGDNSQPAVQDRVRQAEAVIASLSAAAPATQPSDATSSSSAAPVVVALRGPALARVELAKRKVQLGLADEQELVEALLHYHDRFGHVVSCAMDVFCYLELLSGSSRQQLSSKLADRAQQAATDFQQQQQQPGESGSNNQQDSKALFKLLRRQMSARQIQADIGAPSFSDPAAAAQHAQQLMQLYAAALPLYKGLDNRERGPADELLWQAAAALVAAATLEHSSNSSSSGGSSSCIKYLLQAVLVLEAAAKGRPYCAPVRLGLTGLYGLLGNAAGAAQHFGVMDVKHIQHDTLSCQHLLPLLLGLGAEKQAGLLLKPMRALFEDHMADAGDTLMQAYKRGTYTKVLEFVCFKERLERSHTFALARAEQSILSITAAAAGSSTGSAAAALAAAVEALPLEHLDSIAWRGMRFNDDYTTRLPWLPPTQGPRQLVVLLWWEQQQQQAGTSDSSSSAACWWRQVAAAEADVPAAAALRDTMRRAAEQRWLLPHLLHAAVDACNTTTSSSGSSDGDAASQQQLPQLVSRLAAAHGYSSSNELVQAVEAAFGQNSAPATPLSRQLQLLDAALFMLAGSLQDCVVAGSSAGQQDVAGVVNGAHTTPQDRPSVSQCVAWLVAGLGQLQQQLQQQLQPAAAYHGCVLPGQVLSAAALLLSESCCWMLLCLEAWSKALKQTHGKKKKVKPAASGSPAASDHVSPHVEAAVLALTQLQRALESLVGEVHACAKQLLATSVEVSTAPLLAQFDAGSDVMKTLVGWERSVSVQAVLTELVKQQRVLLTQLRDTSSWMASRLHSL